MIVKKNERVPVMIGIHEMKARVLNFINSKGDYLVLVKIGIQYFFLRNPVWRAGMTPEAYPVSREMVEAAMAA